MSKPCFMSLTLLALLLLSSACGAVRSVRFAAGFGPYRAEIEVLLRHADELRAANGDDCDQVRALEARAIALGAVPLRRE